MKITFLGTAAAEGIPAPFCNCATCSHARNVKGVNIRKRASILINDDLLIDAGPDIMLSCALLGISLHRLKYCLITHNHFDHFYPHNMETRSQRYWKDGPPLPMTLVAGPSTLQLLDYIGYEDHELHIKRHPVMPYGTIALAPYTIRSIAATHAPGLGDAVNYIVDDGLNKVLYATDTGIYSGESLKYIEGSLCRLAIIELTNGTGATSKNHLNLDGLKKMLKSFRDLQVLTADSRVYVTHFSHANNPPHQELDSLLRTMGFVCAFDGLVLDIKPHIISQDIT